MQTLGVCQLEAAAGGSLSQEQALVLQRELVSKNSSRDSADSVDKNR